MGIAAELGTVQLRSGTKDVSREKTRDESRETSPEALLKKLNPVKRPGMNSKGIVTVGFL